MAIDTRKLDDVQDNKDVRDDVPDCCDHEEEGDGDEDISRGLAPPSVTAAGLDIGMSPPFNVLAVDGLDLARGGGAGPHIVEEDVSASGGDIQVSEVFPRVILVCDKSLEGLGAGVGC